MTIIILYHISHLDLDYDAAYDQLSTGSRLEMISLKIKEISTTIKVQE